MKYSRDQLLAMYALGRLYFEMGYFSPAERIFNGLSTLDGGQTPARLGLGLVKIERGRFEEAAQCLRVALEQGTYPVEVQLGLCTTFVATGDNQRARSLLQQLKKEHSDALKRNPNFLRLWDTLLARSATK